MKLNNRQSAIPFIVETAAFEGVKRVAEKVACDVKKICSIKPNIFENLPQNESNIVLFATLNSSPLTDRLISENKFNPLNICGKREVYQISIINNPFPNVEQALFICGSDKRGTIYGMFALSEFIGVSPLHFWGDIEPARKDIIEITSCIETISKEPGVKYRGFFINDEWPCFGNWTFSHYGGFNADMYDNVFELLLRLKGNYLWPAMWTSSFALDGPGNLNEELADIYGVIMGASHHEPCLRASEEWDKVKGKNSRYGNEWNYYTNREGLLNYWEDGLKRSGKYEHIITVGMRGERDSSMLGANATLNDNIGLLKDIISNQRELIKKHVNNDTNSVPMLLALYKEVEEYFYGNSDVQGLKDWNGLDGVICMLCEDNFGFMRTLPTEEIRNRKGGFGMYYHFDYHGGPISYEWMPSTPFSKTWEQMSMAYEYGIRDVWIVNVGDLKFNEVSLAYFLSLAYDYEKWGQPNRWNEYAALWIKNTFSSADGETRGKMAKVLERCVYMNGLRRPEAQNFNIYHPCNYLETDRMLALTDEIEKLNEEIYAGGVLSENDKQAYYSMIYFPAKSSINLLRMHLYAGKNTHYAKQGKTIANFYADKVTECIKTDRGLSGEFAAFRNGKWKGMELEQHIGFVKWNDDNYRYPPRITIEPAHKPRMTVSRKDSEEIAVKNYGRPMTITVDDFLYEGNTEVILEIANDGIGSFDYVIKQDKQCEWLTVSPVKGTVEFQQEIILKCDRKLLPEKEQKIRLLIKDKETAVEVIIKGKTADIKNLLPMTFLENNGVIVMEAGHHCRLHNAEKGGFVELKGYGRSGSGMKVFPVTAEFKEDEDNPSLTYRFKAENAGEYKAEIWLTPVNSVQNKRPLRFTLTEPNGTRYILEAVPADFKAGNPGDAAWCDGVLRNIRVIKTDIQLNAGVCEITVGALEAGLVLERILIYRKGKAPKASYLGPRESFFTPENNIDSNNR